MYSDNETNFVGASGILKDEFSNIRSDKEQSTICNQLRQKAVIWHFNPPSAITQVGYGSGLSDPSEGF